jgi:D-tyrosyl-tRNA(Tyr) deacylase
MRIVLQRVSSASVTIAGRVHGRIDRGLLVFVGIEAADTADDGEWLAQKLVKLRIFADEAGQMNLSVRDLDAASGSQLSTLNSQLPRLLLISQFTLHASTRKGARPSFNQAAKPEHARPLYDLFVAQLGAALGRPVATGEFGAMMDIALVNDGPVTLIIDSKTRD